MYKVGDLLKIQGVQTGPPMTAEIHGGPVASRPRSIQSQAAQLVSAVRNGAANEFETDAQLETQTVAQLRAAAVKDAEKEAERVRQIRGLAKAHHLEDYERYWISAGVPLEDVRQEVLELLDKQAGREQTPADMPLFPTPEPADRPDRRRGIQPRTPGR